jgi:hypothetical protein
MQSIQVKYLPATDTQPARLKATCEGGSITEAIDSSQEASEQALNLAFKLSNQLNWNVKEFSRGSFKNCDYFNIVKITPFKPIIIKDYPNFVKFYDKEFDKFKDATTLKIKFTGSQESALVDSNFISISKEQLEKIKQILINSN